MAESSSTTFPHPPQNNVSKLSFSSLSGLSPVAQNDAMADIQPDASEPQNFTHQVLRF
jgi:hypothetical protein